MFDVTNWTILHISASEMWCDEDDSRKSTAYGCLNKSQLNQYCTALAMRTLGSYMCYVEVEEMELRVIRKTGGTGVFLISCVHVHGFREKNMHLWFVFMTHLSGLKGAQLQRRKMCSLGWVDVTKNGSLGYSSIGCDEGSASFQAKVVKYRSDLTTRLSEVYNHLCYILKYLQQPYDSLVSWAEIDNSWSWCDVSIGIIQWSITQRTYLLIVMICLVPFVEMIIKLAA